MSKEQPCDAKFVTIDGIHRDCILFMGHRGAHRTSNGIMWNNDKDSIDEPICRTCISYGVVESECQSCAKIQPGDDNNLPMVVYTRYKKIRNPNSDYCDHKCIPLGTQDQINSSIRRSLDDVSREIHKLHQQSKDEQAHHDLHRDFSVHITRRVDDLIPRIEKLEAEWTKWYKVDEIKELEKRCKSLEDSFEIMESNQKGMNAELGFLNTHLSGNMKSLVKKAKELISIFDSTEEDDE